MTVLKNQVQAKIMLRVDQPQVTRGGQVKDQPSLFWSQNFSPVQQEQLQVTEDRMKCKHTRGISVQKSSKCKVKSFPGGLSRSTFPQNTT